MRRAVLGAMALVLLLLPAFAQDAQKRRGFAVRIAEPENQAVIFGKTKIVAEVEIADPSQVDRVEFIVGDETIFVDREPPFECLHDFGEASRPWIVRVVAHHKEEVTVSDAIVTRQMKFATIERVNRVILRVTAKDNDGNLITDLERDDFKIQEDDSEQRVIDFYLETRPITLAILIDTSGSMVDKIQEVHKAAGAFVDSMRDIDQALLIDFDENVFLIQDLTSDREELKASIESTEPLGATALYDALHAAYRKIGQIHGRKAIVVLSDGDDTSSQFGFKRVLEEAKSNDTMVYTIGLGGGYGGSPRKDVLKDFSENTGGRFFLAKKPGDLAEVYRQIADELGKQYYLTYSTDNDVWDGHWVKIKVDNVRPGIKVRARRGYFAVRGSMLGG
ncbi:MAG: VWA domain-containing protein [bacterium]|nr:VWA domain-containing protein [bacterium]